MSEADNSIEEVPGFRWGNTVYPTKQAALAAKNRESYERSAQEFVTNTYSTPALQTRAKNVIVDYLAFMANKAAESK